MRFELRGTDELLRNLKRLAMVTSPGEMQADALEAVQPVVDDARSLAPVAEGDLRDSINARVFEDGTVGVVIEDWKGHFFEFGTVKMRAQPMLVPAWEANETLLVERFGDRIGVRMEFPQYSGLRGPRTGLQVQEL